MTPLRRQTGRPTIGFLFGNLDFNYMRDLWYGMVQAARTHNANLLCFKGERLETTPQFQWKSANILYSLPHAGLVDGLVITGVIGVDVSVEEFQRVCTSFADIPVITVGVNVPGLPAVEVDNTHGIREVMAHLIEEHGCERIGFIQGPIGNAEAELRYRAYLDALRDHDLPADPALAMPGLFTYNSGRQAIQRAFYQGNPGLDAIVAANDISAFGALEALWNMGYRVPEDVALAGFDDLAESRAVSPPLTTVRQPVFEVGSQAIEQMVRLLAGERIPESTVLPTRIVVRRSCGCPNPDIARVVAPGDDVPPDADPQERRAILTACLDRVFNAQGIVVNSDHIARFVEALLDDVEHAAQDHDAEQPESAACISVLYDILGHGILHDHTVRVWQDGLSVLRQTLLRWPQTRATRLYLETLFQQARTLFGEMVQQIQGNDHIRSRAVNAQVRMIAQELNASFQLDRMRKILIRALKTLKIPRCCVILYDDPEQPLKSAHLLFAYLNGKEIVEHNVSFPTPMLVPETLELWQKPTCFMVEALYVETRQIGLALFEIGPQEGLAYEMLRTQLSSSLRGAMLMQRQQQAQQILELEPIIRQVLNVLEHLAGTSDTLTRISAEMAAGAEEISQQVTAVSESSEHISDVIRSVSSAAIQESASITEIASTVDVVMERITRAVASAQGANATMSDLAASSRQIGDILGVISGVAKQTKFLALYAAIIAAQSGKFESNFTVVAHEVKVLAQETANSAKDIAQKIRMIQLSSQDAVEAISRVVASIYQVSEHSDVISTAINEQSVTTGQISRTIADAAEQSKIITRTTAEVASVAQDASNRAASVQQAAQNLLELAEQLQDLVIKFTEVSDSSGHT